MLVINSSNFAAKDCNRFQDYYPKNMSWNKSLDCCRWDGVNCDRRTGHVIGLDLSCSQLQGYFNLNSSLFQLSHLQKLNLAYNNFHRSRIPREIGWLTSLTHLNLSYSNLAGQIPSEISQLFQLVSLDISARSSNTLQLGRDGFKSLIANLSMLQVLSLQSVNISSKLSMNLSSSFTYLDLDDTRLHGKVADYIFNLPKLQAFILGANPALTGPLPNSIGHLKSLNSLFLPDCNLLGFIPESIGNLTEIIWLDLGGNHFTGQIPPTITNLTQITSLYLDSNSLTGQFPSTITNLTQITYLYLDSNSLTGPLPDHANGLQKLDDFYIGANLVNGTIPPWLFNLPSLTALDLSSDNFTGRISEFKSKSLQYIYLSQNQLHGPIPQSISTFVNLTEFDVSWNNLSGIVQLDIFARCSQLESFRLSHNRLSIITSNNANISFPNLFDLSLSSCEVYEFPNFLRHSEQLYSLDLSNNKIQGQVPMWLTSKWSNSLTYLNLSHNILTGIDQLPWKGLEYLDLQSNLFEGQLPESVCDLSELKILNLLNNNFTSGLPQCLRNLSNLYVLNLSKNNFTGGLLQHLGNLSLLTVLDLRRNKFHGMIPPFAQGSQLRNIGLNGNKLEGPVPRSLANCKGLEVFDVGYNNINDTFPWWLESLPELQVLVLKFNKFHGSITSRTLLKIGLPFAEVVECSGSSNLMITNA